MPHPQQEHPSKRESLIDQFSQGAEHRERLNRVVVIPIDKESADYVLDWAIKNYIRPETDMVALIHVRNIQVPLAPYINPTNYIEDIDEPKREESHAMLKNYVVTLRQLDIACKAIAMIGEPKVEIVRKCTEIAADALIMGSRRFGAVKRTLLGSVSDYCVHNCPCAVVIARPSDKDNAPRRKSIFSFKS